MNQIDLAGLAAGSSPQVRGILALADMPDALSGIIPAGAGHLPSR